MGLALAAFPQLREPLSRVFKPDTSKILTYRARRGNLVVTVKERGNLESSNNQDVVNGVEGQTTIISIKPEGTRVEKGALVCELDSATLKDELINQEITTRGAKAQYDNAEKTYEVALKAVEEYRYGIYPQDLQAYDGDITLAESNLTKARDRLEWSDRMLQKKYVSLAANLADRSALLNAEIALANAKTKKETLVKYTRDKTIKELEAEVEKAKSDMLAKKATLNLEQQKEDKLRDQIEKCKLYAPIEGLIVYSNETSNRPGATNQAMIEEGATVRERQKIFSIPDTSHMRVNTKVHESKIDRLRADQRAKVRVDAFASQQLPGTVRNIATMADPTSWMSSDVKVYTSMVSIDEVPEGLRLRPGMTAEVEILIKTLRDVVSVPMQAVLQLQGKFYLFVVTPDGYSRRVVQVGTDDDSMIEVREGLQEGELVALNPSSLLSNEERNAASASEATGKGWGGSGASRKGGRGRSPGLGGPGGAGGPGGINPANLSPEQQAQYQRFQNASPAEKQQMIEQFKAANPGGLGGGPVGGPGS